MTGPRLRVPVAVRQVAFAVAVFEATHGAMPAGIAQVLATWPDVVTRDWWPRWPYGDLPAGIDWSAIVASVGCDTDVPVDQVDDDDQAPLPARPVAH